MMSKDAFKDIVPSLLLTLLLVVGGITGVFLLVSLLPLIFYGLHILGIMPVREVYLPQPSSKKGEPTGMFEHSHPVIMPRFLYLFTGLLYYLAGTVFFLIPPAMRYFYNWGKIHMDILNHTGHFVAPDHQETAVPFSQPRPPFGSKPFFQGKPHIPPIRPVKTQKAAKKESISDKVARNAMREMESNHKHLLALQRQYEQTLDQLFAGSEMTQERFEHGMREAVGMSARNLKAAQDYLKTGRNPEIIQDFLNRSNTINKKAQSLLDALVSHQQGELEKNLNNLTSSLDALQDSVKFYH